MTHMNDELLVETTQGTNQEQEQQKELEKMNLTSIDLEEEEEEERTPFHTTTKDSDLEVIFDSLSSSTGGGGSPVEQKLVEKSIQYAKLKQENDNLRDQLEEAKRKNELMEEERAATQEMMAEVYDMVHSLQKNLDGGVVDKEHMLTIAENGNGRTSTIIIPSKVRMHVKTIENERAEYKEMCGKLQKGMDDLVAKARKREVRHNHSLRSMKSTIDQYEETNVLLSQKCEALTQAIKELEGDKALQEDKIEALEKQFHMFNRNRLDRAKSPVRESGAGGAAPPYYYYEQEDEEEDDQQTKKNQYPSTRSTRTHHTIQQSKHIDKHQQDEDDTVSNSSCNEESSMTCGDVYGGVFVEI